MEVIKKIWEQHQAEEMIAHPGWWLINLKEVSLAPIQADESTQWQELLTKIQHIITFWQRKWKKWEVSSFDTFSDKIAKLPVATLPMSSSTQMIQNFLAYWNASVDTENLAETACSDILLKKNMFTSSTTVTLEDHGAEIHSDSKLNLTDTLCQLASKISPSGSSHGSTSTMSSFITFLENGETAKFGLEEKIGKRRLTVSNKL